MIRRTIFTVVLCVALHSAAYAADSTLFRIFLADGSSVVSFGDFVRVDDRVVFSMVMGGSTEPRLLVTTLPATAVDWKRTSEQAASTRYQWYAATYGEEDFQRISDDVALVLNEILVAKDRSHALEAARQARATLAAWPAAHYGYRQDDVREIVAILDEAISTLRASNGDSSFAIDFVASPPAVMLESRPAMPSLREQIDQAFHVVAFTDRPAERVSLLQNALALLTTAGSLLPAAEVDRLRAFAETEIQHEQLVDRRYGALAKRLMSAATRGAARARSGDVQRVLDQIPGEDAKLGRLRPDVIQSLQFAVQGQLGAAQRLRLERDRWELRKEMYQQYQKSVGAQLLQLVKSQEALEAIKRLDGPSPSTLTRLQTRLSGGAALLERVRVPSDMRPAHDLLLSSWRFAESAVTARLEATRASDIATAWKASSSAAGALLLLSRAQQELRTLLEPPRLQ